MDVMISNDVHLFGHSIGVLAVKINRKVIWN
jgi:hypothetical protein